MSNVTQPTSSQHSQYPHHAESPPSGGFYLGQMAPTRPPKKEWPISAVLTVVVLGLISLATMGIAIAADRSSQSGASPSATVTQTVTAQAAAAATPTGAAPAQPAGSLTTFKDGTYEIGNGPGLIAAGKYRTTVPTDTFGCYWERLKGLSGQFNDIIANGNADPGNPVIVTIAPTDKAFRVAGCGTWSKA
jgi:hypothetical protein